MNLEEAILKTLDDPVHNRNYIYAKRPYTLESPAFISGRTTLWWDEHTGDVQILAYVKDLRVQYLKFSQIADTQRRALDLLVEHYEEKSNAIQNW